MILSCYFVTIFVTEVENHILIICEIFRFRSDYGCLSLSGKGVQILYYDLCGIIDYGCLSLSGKGVQILYYGLCGRIDYGCLSLSGKGVQILYYGLCGRIMIVFGRKQRRVILVMFTCVVKSYMLACPVMISWWRFK